MTEEVVSKVFDWILGHWALVATALPCIIEITPIFKCNPITALFNWIGKCITKDVRKDIKHLESRINDQEKLIDRNEINRIRYEVLDFANSCKNGRRHTRAEFAHIIQLNSEYGRLLEKYDEKNGVFEADYAYVLELYNACMKENNFLP